MALNDGKQIHSLVLKSGSECFELVGSSLLNFYASCHEIDEARRVFDVLNEKNELLWSIMLVGYVHCNLMTEAMDVFMRMPFHDVISWTTMISGYSRSEDDYEKGLEMFKLMRMRGEAHLNEFTLDSVLRAIGRLKDLNEGKIVHGLSIGFGLESDHFVGGALIELYCNCDVIADAKKVYESLIDPCLNSSNALIGGLIMIGRIEEAEMVSNDMKEMNILSYNLMIKGYAMSGRFEDSKRLFRAIPDRNIVTSNTMISVYCKNGELDEALKLFEQTKWEKNTVTWNSMISGYILNDQPDEAIKLYMTMQRLPVQRNRLTFSSLFHACSCLGSLQQGKLVHGHVVKTPLETDVHVGTSLVDMYAKCGNIIDAKTSFFNISSPNVAAWTCLINGFAHHGLGNEAILVFQQMLKQGISPNAITFVGILVACGRAGLVKRGLRYFHSMDCYGVIPSLEHYTCVVDLLGRSGYLKEAAEFINNMPIEADGVLLAALLNACWHWMDMDIGERVAERMLALDPKQISSYVIMSNIYAGVGKWEEVVKVRKRLRGMEVKKDPGCSWIEVKNTVHVFCVEDRTHPHCKALYAILQDLNANVNCTLEFDSLLSEDETCELVLLW
ncbi:Pentatricopeptide repeat-containing protein [Thalictrum thalictroides]|uniref:Pentatricopeptide repeat-containing protein n=1 Tax=Thalictrum thalictroides TaxID=46969 RepID=A0A7J6WF47_THATH|nr:Pentatricopeptide repeat-containing protein [Thalictrum thalictroides]